MVRLLPSRRTQLVILPIVLSAVASCFLVTDSCACSSVAPNVSVQGTALDSSGVAVQGASVVMTLRNAACEGAILPPLATETDSTGFYALWADGLEEGSRVCADLVAIRVLTAGADTVRRPNVALSFGFAEPVSIDLVFPRRTGPP